MTINAWLKQPTTILGLAGLAGAAAGVATLFATHGNVAIASSVGGPIASVVLLAMNDNSGKRSSVEQLVTDTITAVATRHLTPAVVADVQSLLTAPPAVAITTTVQPAPAAVTPHPETPAA